MPTPEHEPEENVTCSFILKGQEYDRLIARLSNYGDRSLFFREVVRRFLEGDLEIEIKRKL